MKLQYSLSGYDTSPFPRKSHTIPPPSTFHMQDKRQKTIILDLVGVVVNINLERDDKALRAIGLPDFHSCMHNDSLRPILLEYLNGLTTEETFCKLICPYCQPGTPDEDILQAMDEHLDTIPEARLRMIAGLKDRYNVCLLTNIYRRAWDIIVGRMAVMGFSPDDCFHRLFLSYEMQMAKPDHAIYEAVMSEMGSKPHDTIFIDDTLQNVLAAKELGIKAIHIEMNTLDESVMHDAVQSFA